MVKPPQRSRSVMETINYCCYKCLNYFKIKMQLFVGWDFLLHKQDLKITFRDCLQNFICIKAHISYSTQLCTSKRKPSNLHAYSHLIILWGFQTAFTYSLPTLASRGIIEIAIFFSIYRVSQKKRNFDLRGQYLRFKSIYWGK